MKKTCYIVGSGASIRKDQWDISINDLPIWSALQNKHVITLNWGYKFIDPLIEICVDNRFYATEKQHLDKLNLIIGRKDSFYIREPEYADKIDESLFLVNSCPDITKNSWKKGFYTAQLSGIFALSIAIEFGYERIFLLGYDGNDTDGYTHFYQDDGVTGHIAWEDSKSCGIGKDSKGKYKTQTYDKDLNGWFSPFQEKLKTVEIINVNLDSAINIFPKISYDELYEYIKKDEQIRTIETQEQIKQIIREKQC